MKRAVNFSALALLDQSPGQPERPSEPPHLVGDAAEEEVDDLVDEDDEADEDDNDDEEEDGEGVPAKRLNVEVEDGGSTSDCDVDTQSECETSRTEANAQPELASPRNLDMFPAFHQYMLMNKFKWPMEQNGPKSSLLPTPGELKLAMSSPAAYRHLVQRIVQNQVRSNDASAPATSSAAVNANPMAMLLMLELEKLTKQRFSPARRPPGELPHNLARMCMEMRNGDRNIIPPNASRPKEATKPSTSPLIAMEAQSNRSSSNESSSPGKVRQPYTEAELAAAVRAICFGRLGTRRAASVYGIPRSTLRNKICKLNELKRREEEKHGGKPISMGDFLKNMLLNETHLTAGDNEQPVSARGPGAAGRAGLSQTASRIASVFQVNCRRNNVMRKVNDGRTPFVPLVKLGRPKPFFDGMKTSHIPSSFAAVSSPRPSTDNAAGLENPRRATELLDLVTRRVGGYAPFSSESTLRNWPKPAASMAPHYDSTSEQGGKHLHERALNEGESRRRDSSMANAMQNLTEFYLKAKHYLPKTVDPLRAAMQDCHMQGSRPNP